MGLLSAELLAAISRPGIKALFVADVEFPSGIRRYSAAGVSSATDGHFRRCVEGWGPITQGSVDPDGNLEATSFGFTIVGPEADAIRDMLARHENIYGSRLRYWLAGSESVPRAAWCEMFRGRLETPSMDGRSRCTLEFRGLGLFDRPIRLNTISHRDFPNAPEDALGRVIPRIYGKHQSAGLGGGGAVEAVLVDPVGFRYLIGEGHGFGVPIVYVDGVVTATGFSIERATINGRRYTLIDFTGDPGASAVITCDVNAGGIGGTEDPEDVLTTAVKECVSADGNTAGLITVANAVPIRYRSEAGLFLDQEGMTGADVVAAWCRTFHARPYFRGDGTVEVFREREWQGDAGSNVYGGTRLRVGFSALQDPQGEAPGDDVAAVIEATYARLPHGGGSRSIEVADPLCRAGLDAKEAVDFDALGCIVEDEIDRIAPANLQTWLEAWQFADQADGSTGFAQWLDMSGQGRDAGVQGSLLRFATPSGLPAIRLNGTSDDITLGNNNALLTAAAGTIIVVCRIRNVATDNADNATTNDCIFDTSGNVVSLSLRSSGNAIARNEDSGGADVITKPWLANQFQTIVWRHGGGILSIGVGSLDLASRSGIASGNTVGLGANPITVGSNAAATTFAELDIAAIAVWNAALTEDELQRAQRIFRGRYLAALKRDQARTLAALRLLERRNVRNRVTISMPLAAVDHEIGARLDLEDADVPGSTGSAVWQRRPHVLVRRTVRPGSATAPDSVDLELVDQVPYQVAFWFKPNPRLGPADDYSGVAMLPARFLQVHGAVDASVGAAQLENPGSPEQVVRLRLGRAPYCGAFKIPLDGVPGATPVLIRGGLLLSAGVQNLQTRSSGGSGTTGLTLTGTGVNGSAIAADTTDILFDSVTTNSLKFTAGAPHTSDLEAQWPSASVASTALNNSARIYVSVDLKCDSGIAPEMAISRASDGFYFRPSTGLWASGAHYFALEGYAGAAASGERYRHYVPPMPEPATGTDNITVRIRFPSGGTGGRIAHVYHVQVVQLNGDGYCARQINDSAVGTTVEGVSRIYNGNNATDQLWPNDRGTLLLRFMPWGDGSHVVPGETKRLIDLRYSADHYYQVELEASNPSAASAAVLRFRVKGGGGTEVVSEVDASTMRFGREWLIAARWTSDVGELGLPANTITAFLRKLPAYAADGSLIAEGGALLRGSNAVRTKPTAAASEICLGRHSVAADTIADGLVGEILVQPRCLTDDELAHWMA